jgi:hypothetical protein
VPHAVAALPALPAALQQIPQPAAHFATLLDATVFATTCQAVFKVILMCVMLMRFVRMGLIPKEAPVVLSKLAFNVTIPCMLLTSVGKTLSQADAIGAYLVVPLAAAALIFAGSALGWLAAQWAALPEPSSGDSGSECIARSVTAAIGLPPDLAPVITPPQRAAPEGMRALVQTASAFGNSLTLPLILTLSVVPAHTAPAVRASWRISWAESAPFMGCCARESAVTPPAPAPPVVTAVQPPQRQSDLLDGSRSDSGTDDAANRAAEDTRPRGRPNVDYIDVSASSLDTEAQERPHSDWDDTVPASLDTEAQERRHSDWVDTVPASTTDLSAFEQQSALLVQQAAPLGPHGFPPAAYAFSASSDGPALNLPLLQSSKRRAEASAAKDEPQRTWQMKLPAPLKRLLNPLELSLDWSLAARPWVCSANLVPTVGLFAGLVPRLSTLKSTYTTVSCVQPDSHCTCMRAYIDLQLWCIYSLAAGRGVASSHDTGETLEWRTSICSATYMRTSAACSARPACDEQTCSQVHCGHPRRRHRLSAAC